MLLARHPLSQAAGVVPTSANSILTNVARCVNGTAALGVFFPGAMIFEEVDMKREKLFLQLRRICRKTNRVMSVDYQKGKGSHARLTVDGRTTTVKAGELTPAYVNLVLKQLGLPQDALD